MPILVAVLAIFSTLAGGIVALRARDRMHLVLGLSGGILLGLVAFDLLPEVFEASDAVFLGVPAVMIAFVVGFLSLHILERSFGVHEPADSEYGAHAHAHARIGWLGAGGLVFHSFLDGVAIGLGFQVSTEVGWVVAIAVLTHDFADGLNTVSVMLRHGRDRKHALRMLALDAAAPLLGAASTLLFDIPSNVLALYLGAFAGFLVYLAAADILPEAHSHHPSRLTLLATIVGVALMWGVVGITHEVHAHDTEAQHAEAQHTEAEHTETAHTETAHAEHDVAEQGAAEHDHADDTHPNKATP